MSLIVSIRIQDEIYIRVSPHTQRVTDSPSELFSPDVEVDLLLAGFRFLLLFAGRPPLLCAAIQWYELKKKVK